MTNTFYRWIVTKLSRAPGSSWRSHLDFTCTQKVNSGEAYFCVVPLLSSSFQMVFGTVQHCTIRDTATQAGTGKQEHELRDEHNFKKSEQQRKGQGMKVYSVTCNYVLLYLFSSKSIIQTPPWGFHFRYFHLCFASFTVSNSNEGIHLTNRCIYMNNLTNTTL